MKVKNRIAEFAMENWEGIAIVASTIVTQLIIVNIYKKTVEKNN